MVEDNNVRRRVSPARTHSGLSHFARECDSSENKQQCRTRKARAVRVFLLVSPVLLLIGALALIAKREAEPNGESGRRELHRVAVPIENPVAEWTFPARLSSDVTNDLLTLNWDKSLESMKSFIDESKGILKSHLEKEDRLWKLLHDLHNETSATSVVVLRNLPMDPFVPKTPTDDSKSLEKPTYVSEAVLLALGELSGARVIGYAAEKEYSNPWVHEGFPRNGIGSALTAAHELSFHQDMSYQDHIPDILGLYCLREGHDKDVYTTLLDVREIVAQLPEDVADVLRQPRFRIQTSEWVDGSFGPSAADQGRPMLEGGFSLHLPVHWEKMIGLDNDARAALVLLQEAIVTAEPHKVHFEPGMLVFFNNQRAVHGRTPYNDLRFDGGDRVVNRAYFRGELTPEEERTRMI